MIACQAGRGGRRRLAGDQSRTCRRWVGSRGRPALDDSIGPYRTGAPSGPEPCRRRSGGQPPRTSAAQSSSAGRSARTVVIGAGDTYGGGSAGRGPELDPAGPRRAADLAGPATGGAWPVQGAGMEGAGRGTAGGAPGRGEPVAGGGRRVRGAAVAGAGRGTVGGAAGRTGAGALHRSSAGDLGAVASG